RSPCARLRPRASWLAGHRVAERPIRRGPGARGPAVMSQEGHEPTLLHGIGGEPEHGRNVLWSNLLDVRADLEALRTKAPEMANRLEAIRGALDALTSEGADVASTPRSRAQEGASRHAAGVNRSPDETREGSVAAGKAVEGAESARRTSRPASVGGLAAGRGGERPRPPGGPPTPWGWPCRTPTRPPGKVLSLPVHPALSPADLDRLTDVVNTCPPRLCAALIGLGAIGHHHV